MRGAPGVGVVATVTALVAGAVAPRGLDAQILEGDGGTPDARTDRASSDADDRPFRTLGLDEALRLAAERNPRYRRALHDLDLNPTASRQAWSSFLPSLNLDTRTGTGYTRTTRTEDFFGNPIENPDDSRNYTSSANQTLSLSWSFQGLGPRYEVAEARADNRAREQAARSEAHAVEVEVSQAFFEAQERDALLTLEEEMLGSRERELEAAERLFELARRDRTDVLGAELEVARQRSRIEDARGERRKALLALARVVGDPELSGEGTGADPDLRIEPEPVEVFDPADLDAEALVAEALARSPRILREEAALARARAAADRASWERYSPNLSISATLSRSALASDQLALFELEPRDSRTGSLSFGLSVPFDGLLLSGAHQERQAEVSARNQSETLRETRAQVAEEVRARLVDLETAHRNLELAERQRDLAAERLRLTREAYALARRSFDELQTAVREAADARREALSARYEFVRALLEVEAAASVEVERPPAGS